ncbi:Vomp family autotransporter [Bartonella bacilliformis]|uniref:Adhesin/haemagglutinin, bartonella repeat protein family n=3 Tax=Bartonella bacilliformis TaxID=774 RepID=A1UT92_BARBK|nr:Vomp family autotransporter [Bartonella bacilliformis]ABM44568.1 adhesin/haemagglutinin, bartonella repeat protein family [Bartonella bacilliformis KC583]AMG85969.1 adhesin [Bartonella bacilliformis]AYO56658.1 BrpA [Bartonella bacilliformis]EKS43457.1 adhesin/hemagglutinin [Bartonella bacilliformis INS]EYS89716.1 hypothetical protein X472_00149 [Bartonella bacilliformis San Pedro600-02]
MKKLYLIPEENDLNCHHSLRCSPLVKAVSLGTVMAALLSSVSPVFAANVAILGSNVQSSNDGSIPYSNGSHGSIVLAGDNNWCGVDNVTDRGKHLPQSSRAVKEISAEEQYERFVNNGEFFNRHPYGVTTEQVKWEADGVTSSNGGYMGSSTTGGHSNVMPTAFGVYSFATGCGSYASGNYSTAFGAGATTNGGGAQAYGVSALAKGQATIAMGVGAEAWDTSAVAVGGRAVALGKNSVALGTKAKASGDYGVALGTEALAKQRGSIAIGGDIPQEENDQGKRFGAMVEAENAIAIGVRSYASEDSKEAVAIGLSAQVRDEAGIALGRGAVVRQGGSAGVAIGASAHVIADTGVALGTASIASTEHNVSGYNPATGATTKSSDHVWVSTRGAVSIGDVSQKVTRQITGVAAGSEMTDAVNVAQLKALRETIDKGWMLTVNGADATPVGADGLDFSVENPNLDTPNLSIVRSGNKLTFDLAEHIQVGRITTGLSSLSNAGLVIKGCNDGTACKNGPSVTAGGINAGDKTLTGVADAVLDNDAVNFSQLKALKETVDKGWMLTVNGSDATPVGADGADFSVGSSNLVITKDNKNKLTFDLAKDINVNSIKVGKISLDNNSVMIEGGPQISADGADFASKNIRGVADGVLDGDAVNFSQLKALKETVDKGWMLTVNGADATPVGADGADFSVGSSNLVITKDNKNKLTFDLAEHIEVGRITTGLSSLSNAGLVIKGCNDGTACKNGPSVTAGGINAGDKTLTGLADGVLDGDAVNVAQLNKVKEAIKGSGLIQQGENEDENGRITIGAGNSGTEINILNKDGVRRTISGISGGKVTEESTEAINGAQLWETNEEVHNLNHRVDETHTNVSQYFGGGADISSGKAPTYTIEGKQYNNVGSAFSAVNDSLDNIQNEISRHFGQIYTISDIFSHYFGGGAGYNNGKWTAPTYEVSHFGTNGTSSEKAYNNVADAFGGVNESMSGMNDRLQEVENKVDQNKAESDSLGWSKDKGAYDASHDGKPSKIVNVADGQVAQGSEDAVNGGQLWETNERVTNVENKVNDVSKQVDSIENTVNHFADGAVSYQRDESGKKTNKVVLQGGDSGKPVTIDNVADGKIEKGSQEAVNGGQLHDYTQEQMKLVLNDAKKYTDGKIKNIVVNAIDDAVSQAKGYTDMKFEALSYGIEGARKEARQAAAIGLAVSNLRYNDTPGRLSFAFGSGMWRSQSAFALGTGYTSEDGKIQSNFSATTAGGHWGIGAGVSITLN